MNDPVSIFNFAKMKLHKWARDQKMHLGPNDIWMTRFTICFSSLGTTKITDRRTGRRSLIAEHKMKLYWHSSGARKESGSMCLEILKNFGWDLSIGCEIWVGGDKVLKVCLIHVVFSSLWYWAYWKSDGWMSEKMRENGKAPSLKKLHCTEKS